MSVFRELREGIGQAQATVLRACLSNSISIYGKDAIGHLVAAGYLIAESHATGVAWGRRHPGSYLYPWLVELITRRWAE